MRKPCFIAEVKTMSPWGWATEASWQCLLERAIQLGDWVAVHTDPAWGGSFELLREARALVRHKPLVAKGVHSTDNDVARAFECGADYVLVVGRVPKVQPHRCLIEPTDVDMFYRLPKGTMAVWNSRDLATGGLKTETFEDARAAWAGWLCQASNITSPAGIHPSADAFLVGTALSTWGRS
jgi:indole-3-glycerol phosphate synthase